MALGDYTKSEFVAGSAPGISAVKLNNNEDKTKELDTETEVHALNYAMHGELIAFSGYYIVTTFDDPAAGDITETMHRAVDDSVFLTKITEFDTPAAGDITTTLVCASLDINNKVVTEFDTPTAGDIKETASEVT